jgi:hypothetical protein
MDAQRQLDSFIDRFTPEIAALTRDLLARMRARLPGATMIVYDNYNALAIGFGPNDKAGKAILSIAAYPRIVRLYFLQGRWLDDPDGLLEGSGSKVRSIPMSDVARLDDPRIEALIAQALDKADIPIDPNQPQQLLVKAISAKQRPRRPT